MISRGLGSAPEIEGEIARQDAEERARDDAGRRKDGEIERLRAKLAEARKGKGPDG